MDIAEFEVLMMQILISGLCLAMALVVYDLAKKSNVDKWGTVILYSVLGLGVLGFIIKTVIVEMIRTT